mmetsp:Transcript_97207/g.279831  ORF Transcript_97207/g.279831 Transcript_97207/m.279831 type:complete len:230 (-) Transcript_97207:346-1035(-)
MRPHHGVKIPSIPTVEGLTKLRNITDPEDGEPVQCAVKVDLRPLRSRLAHTLAEVLGLLLEAELGELLAGRLELVDLDTATHGVCDGEPQLLPGLDRSALDRMPQKPLRVLLALGFNPPLSRLAGASLRLRHVEDGILHSSLHQGIQVSIGQAHVHRILVLPAPQHATCCQDEFVVDLHVDGHAQRALQGNDAVGARLRTHKIDEALQPNRSAVAAECFSGRASSKSCA